MPKLKPTVNIKIISIGNRGCNVLERLDGNNNGMACESLLY